VNRAPVIHALVNHVLVNPAPVNHALVNHVLVNPASVDNVLVSNGLVSNELDTWSARNWAAHQEKFSG
jgi:hypothetical protein